MRVLVVSLNAAGDLIRQVPVLKAIREYHPQAYITVATSANGSLLSFLFSDYADRTVAINSVDLAREKFNIIYDLSHSEAGFKYARSVGAPKIVSLTEAKNSTNKNAWLKYFSDHFLRSGISPFTYAEVLTKALNIPYIEENKSTIPKGKDLVILLPSDEKKWNTFRFLAEDLKGVFTDYSVRIVIGKNDHKRAQFYFDNFRIYQFTATKLESFFDECACFISQDNTLAEIARIQNIPCVEVVDDPTAITLQSVASVWRAVSKEPVRLCDKVGFRKMVWQMSIDNSDLGGELVDFAQSISMESLIELREETAALGRSLADVRVEIPYNAWFSNSKQRKQVWNQLQLVVNDIVQSDRKDGYFEELQAILHCELKSDLTLFQNLLNAVGAIQGVLLQRKALVECLIQISKDGGYHGTKFGTAHTAGRGQGTAI